MKKSKNGMPKGQGVLLVALAVGVIGGIAFTLTAQNSLFTYQSDAKSYNPIIKAADFTTQITNKYFSLPVGSKFTYESQTPDGLERIEISISGQTRRVMGVNTLVYRDKVWLDGVLIEDTKDYLAQHKNTGDVWYFGENVNNYENGVLVDHDGTWLAGQDLDKIGTQAKPGIWVKANPQKGDTYLQEYYPDIAEDTVDVLSIKAKVKTKFGDLENCLKTYDYTPLDDQSKEHKYYCPAQKNLKLGTRVLTEHLIQDEKMPLIDIKMSRSLADDDEDDKDDDN